MEREREVTQAKVVLRRFFGLRTKRHDRIHDQAAEDNADRLRALEGLCGQCKSLVINFGHRDGKDTVVLVCKKGYLPTALYANTLMGQEAFCNDFVKEEK